MTTLFVPPPIRAVAQLRIAVDYAVMRHDVRTRVPAPSRSPHLHPSSTQGGTGATFSTQE